MIILGKILPVPTNTAEIIWELLSYLPLVLALVYLVYLLVKNWHSIFAPRICPKCGKKLKTKWVECEPFSKFSRYRIGDKLIFPGLKELCPVLYCSRCGYRQSN